MKESLVANLSLHHEAHELSKSTQVIHLVQGGSLGHSAKDSRGNCPDFAGASSI